MAATVSWNGTTGPTSDGVVNNADNYADGTWAVVKITSGGGTPSVDNADGSIEGSGAVTITSNNKRVVLYTDIGASNTLDFTSGGNAYGQMVYIWGSFLAAGLLQTRNTGGFGMFLESNTPSSSQYHLWYFYGSDNYSGGWKRFVLDPNKTASASAGSALDLTAVRYFGLFADTTSTARFDNLIVDQIRVGTGLTVTGTSTTDALISDLLADEATNHDGIIQGLNDSQTAVELNGQLTLGDTTASTNSTLSDINSKIFIAEPRYYDGSSFVASVPTDYFSVSSVGGTGTNSITIGKSVGTDAGRSGWTVVGNSTYTANMSFDDGNVDTSSWYGCSFENLTGTLSWGTNTAHKLFSSSFTGCSQFDPVGGPQIRNCLMLSTASTSGCLLWNDSIDIDSCQFISNTTGAGIEMPSATGSPYTYQNLTFSGNTYDVNNSSGSAITINEGGTSNPSTSTGSSVTFIGNIVTTSITVQDLATASVIQSAEVLVWVTDNANYFYQASVSITGSGTTATVTHTGHGMSTGDHVIIEGVTNDDTYNGAFSVTVSDANTYTYTTTATLTASPATGTPIATFALISGTTNSSGVVSDSRSLSTSQPIIGWVRKSSASPYYQQGAISGTVSNTSGLSVTVQLASDE